MRKFILFLLLAVSAYCLWFYLTQLSGGPVRSPLVRSEKEAIRRIDVVDVKGQPFTLRLGEDGKWVVSREQQLLYGQEEKVAGLLALLTATKSDSLVKYLDREKAEGSVSLHILGDTDEEDIDIYYFRDDKLPLYGYLPNAQLTLAFPPASRDEFLQHLNFNAYRERRLLDLAAGEVDSIMVMRGDSLLWGITSGDLSRSAQQFIAPAAAPYADFFDEIAFRDREYADILLYSGAEIKTVKAYRDTLWPHPFVLVGEDYPRRFLGYESLR